MARGKKLRGKRRHNSGCEARPLRLEAEDSTESGPAEPSIVSGKEQPEFERVRDVLLQRIEELEAELEARRGKLKDRSTQAPEELASHSLQPCDSRLQEFCIHSSDSESSPRNLDAAADLVDTWLQAPHSSGTAKFAEQVALQMELQQATAEIDRLRAAEGSAREQMAMLQEELCGQVMGRMTSQERESLVHEELAASLKQLRTEELKRQEVERRHRRLEERHERGLKLGLRMQEQHRERVARVESERGALEASKKQLSQELRSTKQHCDEAQRQLRQRSGDVQALDVLPEDQLRDLEDGLQEAHRVVQRALRSKIDEQKECIVCYSNLRNMLFLPCNHMILCERCAEHCGRPDHKCPKCRKAIEQTVGPIVH